MRIGLLQCDHVNAEFQPLVGDYPDLFANLLTPAMPDIELVVYDVTQGQFPANVRECEGYISTGSRQSVYDDVAWIHDLSAFVRDLYANQQKFVGICFGHQMIAHALGGEVKKTGRGWGIGVKSVEINQPQAWMQPAMPAYNLLLSHQDQVETLPPDARVIGSNAHCPNSMIVVGEHFLGIQAHPEFTPHSAAARPRPRPAPPRRETVDQALATLSTPIDSPAIAQWITAFLGG
ncbi:MAG: type 1 glutamine amidotransferase [Aggregatilineales bacterium]